MRFMQIANFYPRYLRTLFASCPGLAERPFAEQIGALVADGFGAGHLVAPHMGAIGHEALLVIANCTTAQAQWALENGIAVPQTMAQGNALLVEQVRRFRPDVLYILDPIAFDGRFVAALSPRPRLVVGWRAATIPAGVDWTGYDLLLSSDERCRQRALELGCKAAEMFRPGFPAFLAEAVAAQSKTSDVVFCGQITAEHSHRLAMLGEVGQAASDPAGRFGLDLHLGTLLADALPAGVGKALEQHVREAVWGIDMYRTVRSGRIGLNFHIDIATVRSQNMRVLETTGVGTFLLTEASDGLEEQFVPGKEIETYASAGELLEKIRHYLDRPEEREAIAQAGQVRCLAEHSMEQRARQMAAILQAGLQGRLPPGPDTAALFATASEHFRAGRFGAAASLCERIVKRQPDHADALHLSGLTAHCQGAHDKAERLIRTALERASESLSTRWTFLANLGTVLHALGRHAEAEAALREAAAINPTAPILAVRLGDVLRVQGRYDAAQEQYRRALTSAPNNAEALLGVGACALATGRLEVAAEACRAVLAIAPEHGEARAMLERVEDARRSASVAANPLVLAFPGVSFGHGVQCIGLRSISIGAGSCIADDVWLNVNLRTGPNRICIGRSVLIGRRGVISSADPLEIGSFCLFAPNVYVSNADHDYSESYRQPLIASGIRNHGPLVVEENCWLGMNSVVSGGFRIGRGSVVGANTVVRGDVPPFAVVVGNPGRVVKLFNSETRTWEPVRAPDDLARIEDARRRIPLPSREQYAEFLLRTNGGRGVDPIVAGRGEHLP